MTWSITRSKIVGGDAIVKWNNTPLRQLSDADFITATEAANALGECVVLDATELKPGLEIDAARADLIIRAVIAEMGKRGGATSAPHKDFSDTGLMPETPMEGPAS